MNKRDILDALALVCEARRQTEPAGEAFMFLTRVHEHLLCEMEKFPLFAPEAGECSECGDGLVMSDTCDECDERHCSKCESCEEP